MEEFSSFFKEMFTPIQAGLRQGIQPQSQRRPQNQRRQENQKPNEVEEIKNFALLRSPNSNVSSRTKGNDNVGPSAYSNLSNSSKALNVNVGVNVTGAVEAVCPASPTDAATRAAERFRSRSQSEDSLRSFTLTADGVGELSSSLTPAQLLERLENEENGRKFFTEDFDAVKYVLAQIPAFEYQSLTDGSGNNTNSGTNEYNYNPNTVKTESNPAEELDAYILEQMSIYDITADAVKTRLMTAVQNNTDLLIRGMRQVQEIDLDLTRAVLTVRSGRRKLGGIKSSLIKGGLDVVYRHRERDRCKDLMKRLEFISNIVKRRKTMHDLVNEEKVCDAVQLCLETLVMLDSSDGLMPDKSMYVILRKLREQMVAALPTLRKSTDQILSEVCSTASVFNPGKYEQVILAYVALDGKLMSNLTKEQLGKIAQSTSYDTGLASSSAGYISSIDALPEKIQRTFINLSEQAFRKALITFLEGWEKDKEKDKKKNQEQKPKVTVAQARGMSLEQLSERVSVSGVSRPSLVRCMCFAFETICDLLHNHFLVMQWHADPLSEESRDLTYLHRELDQELPEKHTSKEEIDEKVLAKLNSVHRSLKLSRRYVWGAVQSQLGIVLKGRACQYPNLKLQAFHQLIELVDVLCNVGKAYAGDTYVLETRAMVREMCKTYIQSFHNDCVESLQNLLKRDSWKKLNVELESFGGMEGLVERGRRRQLARAGSLEHSLVPSNGITSTGGGIWSMHDYETKCNPFSVSLKLANSNISISIPDVSEDIESSPEQVRTGSDNTGRASPGSMRYVYTTTVVNCLARDVGRYLTVMEKLPLFSADALGKLQQLYNEFICVLLTNFVPMYLLQIVFDQPGSSLGKDYQLLRQYITLNQSALTGKDKSKAMLLDSNGEMRSQIPPRVIVLDIGLDNFEASYATSARIVAGESLLFAYDMLEHIKGRVEIILPPVERAKTLQHIYDDMKVVIHQTRQLIFKSVAKILVYSLSGEKVARNNHENFIKNGIANTKWRKGNMRPKASSGYVKDVLFRARRIWAKLKRESNDGINYPLGLLSELWNVCMGEVFNQLLEAYATVEQCDIQGRAQMMYDNDSIYTGIENIAPIAEECIKRKKKTESYLKAFFIDRSEDVNDWIKRNGREYEQYMLTKLNVAAKK